MKRLLVIGLLLLSACKPDDQRTDTIDAEDVKEARAHISPRLVTHLDSGNAAFKARDYQRAKLHYEAVTKIDKDAAAGWFGIYMSELALGDTAAAKAALERAQKHAPGATLIHPTQ